jgi:signal transduction histidine kinase
MRLGMVPERFRKHLGFAAFCAAPLSLLAASPAVAQSGVPVSLGGIAPVAVVLGAGAFSLIAMAVVRSILVDTRAARRRASSQIADLRNMVDEYESLIAGSRELTVLWTDESATPAEPRILGDASAVLPMGRQPHSVLNLRSWLGPAEANRLQELLDNLKMHGHRFSSSLKTLDGRQVRCSGWVMGGAIAMRLRPAYLEPGEEPSVALVEAADWQCAQAIITHMPEPAFLRLEDGKLDFANPALVNLAQTRGKSVENLDLDALAAAVNCYVVEFDVPGGIGGYLASRKSIANTAPAPVVAPISGLIDNLGSPIAIFNAKRQLVQFNQAYSKLWGLDRLFLTPGTDERAILDKLRTEGRLPNTVDYHTWRANHLKSYERTEPFEADPWHLPDGRTVKLISAPAGAEGGVVYVFEDMTEWLNMASTNKAFTNVQRETINALSEAVAVFGTNGRLTLWNPRFEELWAQDKSELETAPHIDQIASRCALALPHDGPTIWRDLKRAIIDLNPTRTDQKGRITRSDGKLIDFSITRLPDGQSMMTFIDVTESASYSKVLKERNDALVAADRLKDAFVENVSYELRSPLTSIIGFAEVLAADESSPLTAQQRDYISYIRASSVSLGVLIDNILDLASVDAGIAELNPERLDVPALIEKARAGISATMPEVTGLPAKLVVDIEPNLPPLIADGTRLVQVLYNLLSNAARFAPPGSEIRLSVSSRDNRMLFVIDDEGPGLTDELKSAILTRLDTPAQGGRQRGAGLGLSIVRTFVNLHGGTISAERREPKGSRIIVNLPRDSAMASVAE